jgi:hypothetical protein
MIYTAGYSGHTAPQLLEVALEKNALVLDIRFSPWSWQAEWRKYALESLLDGRYAYVKNWGNRNYNNREAGIEIVDFAAGLKDMMREGVRFEMRCNFILLCQCPVLESCHRAVVAEMMRAEGYRVEELYW